MEDIRWPLLLVKAELIKVISAMKLEVLDGDKSHQRVVDVLELSEEVINHLEIENQRLKGTMKSAIELHHSSIIEVLKKHERAQEWLESAKELTEDEKHDIFSIWLLKQALEEI